ncbi:unknown [Rickettsia felis URRWXCal2]|uniref:Uncharacterized protein n=2 Tax=spotted fever group TaxID=114277 RepID=A8F2P2_RICM5|nr:unknown [Rickettsia felis URRWXCal2]ABV85178.1 hypothetical protein RMA_1193 [Rickettsia massiliae MTU5]
MHVKWESDILALGCLVRELNINLGLPLTFRTSSLSNTNSV